MTKYTRLVIDIKNETSIFFQTLQKNMVIPVGVLSVELVPAVRQLTDRQALHISNKIYHGTLSVIIFPDNIFDGLSTVDAGVPSVTNIDGFFSLLLRCTHDITDGGLPIGVVDDNYRRFLQSVSSFVKTLVAT